MQPTEKDVSGGGLRHAAGSVSSAISATRVRSGACRRMLPRALQRAAALLVPLCPLRFDRIWLNVVTGCQASLSVSVCCCGRSALLCSIHAVCCSYDAASFCLLAPRPVPSLPRQRRCSVTPLQWQIDPSMADRRVQASDECVDADMLLPHANCCRGAERRSQQQAAHLSSALHCS